VASGNIKQQSHFKHVAYMADQAQKPPPAPAREFFIQGITSDGKQFRPSDWAERLCGVMSCFRPEGSGGPNAHLQYSPYVRPTVIGGVKAVVVNEDLRDIEPLAFLHRSDLPAVGPADLGVRKRLFGRMNSRQPSCQIVGATTDMPGRNHARRSIDDETTLRKP
jgi:hypothetical protein